MKVLPPPTFLLLHNVVYENVNCCRFTLSLCQEAKMLASASEFLPLM
jgi:hypothetical protein